MYLDSIQSWGDDRGGGASHAGGHARAARPAPQRGRRAGVRRRWGDGAVQLRRGRRWSAQPHRGDAARDGLHRAPGRPGAGDHRGVRVDAAGPDPPRGLGRADAPAWATERAAGRGSESGPFLAGGGADRRSDRGPPGRARHDGGPGAGWGRAAGLGGGRRTDHPGGPGVARAGAYRAGADRAGADRAGADRAGADRAGGPAGGPVHRLVRRLGSGRDRCRALSLCRGDAALPLPRQRRRRGHLRHVDRRAGTPLRRPGGADHRDPRLRVGCGHGGGNQASAADRGRGGGRARDGPAAGDAAGPVVGAGGHLRPAGAAAGRRRRHALRRSGRRPGLLRRRPLRALQRRPSGRQGMEHQTSPRPARPGGHAADRRPRPGRGLRFRGAFRADLHPARRAHRTPRGPRPGRPGAARLRPGWGLPGRVHRLPAGRRGLGHLPARRPGRGHRASTAVATRRDGKRISVPLADETVQINGYGAARQLTLFEDGAPVLQVLTSDTTATGADLLCWLRARWRIENMFKYASAHNGIDTLADYLMDIGPDTRTVTNPARVAARKAVAEAQAALVTAERALPQLLAGPGTPAQLNAPPPAVHRRIEAAAGELERAKTALRAVPAKVAATELDPNAKRARPRLQRRGLQMVLRLLAFNAEAWLAEHFNAYLTDPNEYRAILRNLLHLGGQVDYTTNGITVTLDRPDSPRVARALELLAEELNATPACLPGDRRRLTYQVTAA